MGLAAAATLAVAGLAGCASAGGTTTADSVPAGSAAAPGLTQAAALQAFDGYVTTSNQAAGTNDGKLALSVVTGPEQSLVSAVLGSHAVTVAGGSGDGGAYSSSLTITPDLTLYRYGAPTFYLPEASGYPRFFLADVTRGPVQKSFTPGDPDATTSVGGAQVPVDGRVLMVFEQSAAAGPWQLASVAQFPAGTALPQLATDKNGYVPQASLTSTDLLAQPYATGPLQAAVVDDGPASAAAKAVAAGPLTTGLYQAARERTANELEVPAGDVYQWSMEGTPYPTLALRTADGGALVLYAMYLNSTVAVPGYFDEASPVNPGPPITVPPGVLAQLPSGQPAPRIKLEAQSLFSFAAIDPPASPASPAKITVLAIGGALNYASAS